MTDALPPASIACALELVGAVRDHDLDERDAEISRCLDCCEWRWRASYLACQNCGAASVAARIAPPRVISDAERQQRWAALHRSWTCDKAMQRGVVA
jgi:hypothetical protein